MNEEPHPDVARIAQKTGLPLGIIESLVGEIARMKESKRSAQQIADRFGVGFAKLKAVSNMGRVAINEAREAVVTTSLITASMAKQQLVARLSDPEAVAKINARDLSTIDKQQSDIALNYSNGCVAGPQTNISIGDMKVLIQRHAARGPRVSIREQLLARGIDVDKIPQAPSGE